MTLRVEFLGFFIYICAMDNLKRYIIKKKYDILAVGCFVLMFQCSVLFAIPTMIFIIVGEFKSEN
jgi:hypothetical protein